MAYGLLALLPWQWEELCERCTVAEIEKVITGAIWRDSRWFDRLSWHAWRTGTYAKGTRLADVRGKQVSADDPRDIVHDPEWEARQRAERGEPLSEKAQRGLAMIAAARAQRHQLLTQRATEHQEVLEVAAGVRVAEPAPEELESASGD